MPTDDELPTRTITYKEPLPSDKPTLLLVLRLPGVDEPITATMSIEKLDTIQLYSACEDLMRDMVYWLLKHEKMI